MYRVTLSILGLASVAAIASSSASRSSPIEGVWRATEVTLTGPRARTIGLPQLQPGWAIMTANHYSRVEIHGDGPRSTVPDATKASADELRQMWGPVFAEAGRYETSRGNTFTLRPVVAKDPAAMASGVFATYSYRLAGDTLWVTLQRDQRGPVTNPPTIKLTRVE